MTPQLSRHSRPATWPGRFVLVGAALSCLTLPAAGAQEPQGAPKAKTPDAPPPLFADATPLEITLHAPYRQLRRDRTGESMYRQARVSYTGDGGEVSLPVRVRTRGIWRRKNCDLPPLLLNFTKDSTKGSAFAKLDRVRLSPHCKDTDEYEQYVLQDFQLYRVQQLLTPFAFAVRLVRVSYVDSERKDTVSRRWAYLQEQDEPFADRMGLKLMTLTGAAPNDLDPYESAFTGVWQFFIGNTDFSIRGLHNIVLLEKPDFTYVPVARDFDFSGAVNTRYAGPPPQIMKDYGIKYVTQRVMRGYCAAPGDYEKVFAVFRDKRDAIRALYADPIGALLKPRVASTTLEFFDKFYEIINDPEQARKRIVEACLSGSA